MSRGTYRGVLALSISVTMAAGGWLAAGSPGKAFAFVGHSYYVATTGSDATTCQANSNLHPFHTINRAMACVATDAPPPFAPDLVHIAAGTYHENVAITDNVNLLGAGAGITTINGGGSGSVISNGDPFGNLSCPGSGAAFTVAINGVTVTDGNTYIFGGGICNDGTMTLSNSIVTANLADSGGGGIANDGSMALVNTPVTNNGRYNFGGGIYNYSPGTMRLNNSPVAGNAVEGNGGGIYNDSGTMTLDNSRVSDNSTPFGIGGGVDTVSGRMTLTNSPVGGSHLYATGDSTAGNQAESGGGIYNGGGTTSLLNSPVSYNSTEISGGGILHAGGSMSLMNSAVNGNVTSGQGGGIATYGAPLSLKNESIVHNTASDEGGLYDAAAAEPDDSCAGQTGVTMSNTTISQNTPDNC